MEHATTRTISEPNHSDINRWAELPLARLSPRLQEFEQLIGIDATMRLVERFGGLRIFIPANPKSDHPYAEIIGFENLVKLSKEYSSDGLGLRMTLPTANSAFLAQRDARILSGFSHKSTRELAREYGLHERQITRIVMKGIAPSGRDSHRSLMGRPKQDQRRATTSLAEAIARSNGFLNWPPKAIDGNEI